MVLIGRHSLSAGDGIGVRGGLGKDKEGEVNVTVIAFMIIYTTCTKL